MIAPNKKLIEELKSTFGFGVVGSCGETSTRQTFDFNNALTASECSEIGHCDISHIPVVNTVFKSPISVTADEKFDFYAEAVKQNEPTPKESAEAGIRNAMSFTELSIKSGAIDGHNLELIDQASAIMQAVLDNLDKQELPAEFSYHMANAVNELEACQKLCSGKLHKAVFDVSVAVERIRDEAQS